MKAFFVTLSHLLSKVILAGFLITVLVSSVATIGFSYYLPRADHYREALLGWLNEQYEGTHVDAKKITGHFETFRPSLTLTQVQVKNPAWHSELSFSELTVQLDILKSLKHEKAIFSHVGLSDLEFSLIQNNEGEWQLSTDNMGEKKPADLRSLILSLWGIENLKIDNLKLHLKPHNKPVVAMPALKLTGINEGGVRNLTVKLRNHEQKIILQAEAQGEPFQPDFIAKGLLDLKKYDDFDFLCLLDQESQLKSADIKALVWFDWAEETLTLMTDLKAKDIRLNLEHDPKAPPKPFDLKGLNLTSRIEYHAGVTQVWLPATEITINEDPLILPKIYIKNDKTFYTYIESINLDDLQQIQHWQLLPKQAVQTLMELSPTGHLSSVHITRATDDVRMSATLENISVNAWRGAPQLRSVNGQLRMHNLAGSIDLDTQNFSMYFPDIFTKSQDFEEAKGQIHWVIDDGALALSGESIAVNSVYGDAFGEFHLQVPLDKALKAQEPGRLVIDVDVKNGSSEFREALIPKKRLPASLNEWLDDSIQSATIPDAKFIFHGPISEIPDEPNEKIVAQLWLAVDEGSIQYLKDLPAISKIQGEMWLDDTEVSAHVIAAESLGIQLSGGTVALADANQGLTLQVASHAKGKLTDLQQFLTLPLLNNALDQRFESLQMAAGKFDGRFDFTAQLADFEKTLALKLNTDIHAGELIIHDADLVINEIKGDLAFELGKGFSSQKLTATLFDKFVEAKAWVDESMQGSPKTQLTFATQLDVSDVRRWKSLPELVFFDGEAPVLGRLTFNESSFNMSLSSNLKGVSIALPEPFTKLKDEKLPLHVDCAFSEKGHHLAIRLDDSLQANLSFNGEKLSGGRLAINSPVKQVESNKFIIHGELAKADFTEWMDAIDAYAEASSQGETSADDLEISVSELDVHQLFIDQFRLKNVALQAKRFDTFWHVDFTQDYIEGGLDWYSDTQPLSVYLKLLDLDNILNSKVNGAQHTPDAMNFKGVPDMDIVINTLLLAHQDLGFWQLKSTVDEDANALMLTDITAKKGDIVIDAIGKGSPAFIRYSITENLTSMAGRLSGKDFSNVLTLFGFGKEVTSKKFDIISSLTWEGNPGDFALAKLHGEASLKFQEGSFTDIESSSSAAIKVIGILNISYLLKRLKLDFSDLTKKGFAFDSMKGAVNFNEGYVRVKQPVVVKSPSSNIRIDGNANMKSGQLDLEMAVSLPLASNLPWIATLVASGAAGLWPAAGIFLVGHLFKNQVNKLSTFIYQVKGNIAEPSIQFKKMFDSEGKERKPDKVLATNSAI
ncbi:MAG: DUF3971 domain-containing protein [Cellvibrionales bacterium]|nr:DUF3971 domain-containing protein [Cellvibrionales bacterium]